jgi:hypothetical protein
MTRGRRQRHGFRQIDPSRLRGAEPFSEFDDWIRIERADPV